MNNKEKIIFTEKLYSNIHTRKNISLACPFSRPWAVSHWFNRLLQLNWEGDFFSEVAFYFVVDGDETFSELCKHLHKLPSHCKYRIFLTNTNPLANYGGINIIKKRRQRILQIWKFLWEICEGEIIIGSEDDSLFYPDTINTLYKKLIEEKNIGFIQSSILGRWNCNMIPHWKKSYNMWTTYDLKFKDKSFIEIDGGGWYCFVARHVPSDALRWEVVENDLVGPDVIMVNSFKSLGYTLLGATNLWIDHMLDNDKVLSIDNVDFIDKLVLKLVNNSWQLSTHKINKNNIDGEKFMDLDNNTLVYCLVLRNYQGAEGFVTKDRKLVVPFKRFKELEAKRLAKFIGEVKETSEVQVIVQDPEPDPEPEIEVIDFGIKAQEYGPRPPEPIPVIKSTEESSSLTSVMEEEVEEKPKDIKKRGRKKKE